jgi:hypothetical protein
MSTETRWRVFSGLPVVMLVLGLAAQPGVAQEATANDGGEAAVPAADAAQTAPSTAPQGGAGMGMMPPRGAMPMGGGMPMGRGMHGGMPMQYGPGMRGGMPMQGCRGMGGGYQGQDRMAMKQQRRDMMQQRHAKMDAHMQSVEERLARIEQLVQQLVEAKAP